MALCCPIADNLIELCLNQVLFVFYCCTFHMYTVSYIVVVFFVILFMNTAFYYCPIGFTFIQFYEQRLESISFFLGHISDDNAAPIVSQVHSLCFTL